MSAWISTKKEKKLHQHATREGRQGRRAEYISIGKQVCVCVCVWLRGERDWSAQERQEAGKNTCCHRYARSHSFSVYHLVIFYSTSLSVMSSTSDISSEQVNGLSSPSRDPNFKLSSTTFPHAHSDDNSGDNNPQLANSPDPEDDRTLPEEPVLSHADKRRQKKKQSGKQLSGSDETHQQQHTIPSSATDNTLSSVPSVKRQNSVWVGNLAFKTSPDALRKFFDGVGEITRVHMPMKLSSRAGAQDNNNKRPLKENRGSAFSVAPPLPSLSLTSMAMSSPIYFQHTHANT